MTDAQKIMHSIFYDLETSDQYPIGQILNYSFIVVDSSWNIVDECNGEVLIKPGELPSPGAILANRVNVLEQQKRATDTEYRAMQKIFNFFSQCIIQFGSVNLIGFNSSKFDLNYLRTSLIRNGFNPYFSGKLQYRDLLHAAQYLSCTHPKFPRKPARGAREDKLSLRLETLCHAFELLEGKQAHESRADVILTIALAKIFANQFQLDVRTFNTFPSLQNLERGQVWSVFKPQYELSHADIFHKSKLLLLDKDHRSSLWINLAAYEEDKSRSSISWQSAAKHALFLDQALPEEASSQAALQALRQFSEINLKNFFSRSTCDIESDIYRLDFDCLERLGKAIRGGEVAALYSVANADLKTIFQRFIFSNHKQGPLSDVTVRKYFEDYCMLRYLNNALQLSRDLGEHCQYAPSLKSLYAELKKLQIERTDEEDRLLLSALEEYYQQSYVAQALAASGVNSFE